MVPAALYLLPYGIAGVAVAVTGSYIIGFGFNLYQVHRVLPGAAGKMIPAILPALLSSIVMLAAIALARLAGERVGWLAAADWLFLLYLFVVGAVVYISTAFVLRRTLVLELVGLLQSVLGKRFSLPPRPRRVGIKA